MAAVIRVSAVYTMSDQVSSKLARMAARVMALEKSLNGVNDKLDKLGKNAKTAVSPLGDVNKQLNDMKKTVGTTKGSNGLLYRVDQLGKRLKALGGGRNGHQIRVSTKGVKSAERDLALLQAKAAALSSGTYKIKLEVDRTTISLLREQATALDRVAGSIKDVKLGFSALKQGETELRSTMKAKTQAAQKQRKVLSEVSQQMKRSTRDAHAFKRAVRDGEFELKSFSSTVRDSFRDVARSGGSFSRGFKMGVPFARMLPMLALGANLAGVAVGGLMVALHGVIAPIMSVASSLKDMVGVVALLPAAYGAAAVAVGSFMGAMNSYFGDALTNAGKLNEIQKKLDTVKDAEQRKTLMEQQSKLLDEMNPKQRKLAESVRDLMGEWRKLFTDNTKLQDAFFGTADKAVATASKMIQRYGTDITATANSVRKLADGFLNVLRTNKDVTGGMRALFRISRDWVGTLTRALDPLMGFLGRVLMASEQPMARIADSFERWAVSLNNINTGKIERFIDRGVDSASLWWSVLKDIALAFNNIFRAGSGISSGFADAAKQFREFTESAEGFSLIRREFENGMKVAKALGRFTKVFVHEFMKMGADGAVGKSVIDFIDTLTNGLPRLFDFMSNALRQIGPSLTAFLRSFPSILEIFEAAAPGMKIALDILTQMNKVFGFLIDNVPGLKQLLGVILALNVAMLLFGGAVGHAFGFLLSGALKVGALTKALRGMRGVLTSRGLVGGLAALATVGSMGGRGGRGGKGGGTGGMGGASGAMGGAGAMLPWIAADVAMSGMGGGHGAPGGKKGTALSRGYQRGRSQGLGRGAAAMRGGRGALMAGGAALASPARGAKAGWMGARGAGRLAAGRAALNGLGPVLSKLGPQMMLFSGALGAVSDYLADDGPFISKLASGSKGFLKAIDVTRILPGDGLSGLLPKSGAELKAEEDARIAATEEFSRLQVEMKTIVDRIADTRKQLEEVAVERDVQTRSVDLQNPAAQRGMTRFRVASGEDPAAAAAAVEKAAKGQLTNRVNATYHKLQDGMFKNTEDLAAALKKHGHKNSDAMAQRMWKQVIDDGLVKIKGKLVKPVSDKEHARLTALQTQTTSYLQSQPGFEGITAGPLTDPKTGAPVVRQGEATKATAGRKDEAWLNANMPDWKAVAADIKGVETNLNEVLKVDEQLLLEKMPALEAAGKAAGLAPMNAIKQAVKQAQPGVDKAIKKSGDDQKKAWTKAVKGSGGILPLLSIYTGEIDGQITALGTGTVVSTPTGAGSGALPAGGPWAAGASPTAMAGGGVVGGDSRRPDSVHTLLKPGEVVLNEGQQRKLGMATVKKSLHGPGTAAKGTFGFNMSGASSSALNYAGGGVVPALKPYMDAAVKMGGIVTSTTGGTHAANSQHYSGHAFDVDGGAGNNMRIFRAFEPDARVGKVTELFHDPAGGYSGGRSIGPIGGHGGHVHTGVRGGRGGFAGIAGMEPPKAKTPPNFGNSPIGQATQKRVNAMMPAVQARLNAAHAASFGSMGGYEAGHDIPGSPKAIGQQMAADMYGWTGNEWSALEQLWDGESRWDPKAKNKSSGAYGIPQALPASKLPPAGQESGGSSPAAQIGWGLNYIKNRPDYGSPSKALSMWKSRSPHWYGGGGEGMATSPEVIGVGDKREHVQITPSRTEAKPSGAINSTSSQGPARANITNNFYVGVLAGDEKAMHQLAAMVGTTIADQLEGAAGTSVTDSADVMGGNG